MKKNVLMLVATLIAAPALAGHPEELQNLGLNGLEEVSEDAGLEVRGLSANAYASGLSTVRAFVIDPDTGSTFNANSSNFNRSSDSATGGDTVFASANSSVGFAELKFVVGQDGSQFGAVLDGLGFGSGASGTNFGNFDSVNGFQFLIPGSNDPG